MEAAIAGFPGDRMAFAATRIEAIMGLGIALFSRGRRNQPSGPALRKIRLLSRSRASMFTPVSA